MQLKLSFDTETPLSLPLGHHSTVQGFIYGLLNENPDYSAFLHDSGYGEGAHSFKLFVFSTLTGNHSIRDGRIIFHDRIFLEVRSPKQDFCSILTRALENSRDIRLGGGNLTLSEWTFSRNTIESGVIDIRMLSPLTLSTTYYESEKKKTRYYSPLDSDFQDAFIHNTGDKYLAACGRELPSPVSLETLSLSSKDKYVTRFDNIYINAWNGTYRLTGSPEVLTFLYDTGIGSRNSQGFGMFEEI